jgi:hypothetical protein
VNTEDFSLWRSPRQGAVLETTNQDVSKKVIELINRWRSKEAASGSVAGLPMRQVSTQVKSTVPHACVLKGPLTRLVWSGKFICIYYIKMIHTGVSNDFIKDIYSKIIPSDFVSKVYLELNPDVNNASEDPVYHYLNYGIIENRIYNYSQIPNGFTLDYYIDWINKKNSNKICYKNLISKL